MPENSNPKPRLWTPVFTMLTVANFGVAMGFFMTMATMASFAISQFAASNTSAGLVNSVFVLGAMASRIVGGKLTQTVGFKRIIVWSVSLNMVAAGLYFVAVSLPVTVLIRIAHGFLYGMVQTALSGAVMMKVPASRRAEGSGWFTTGLSLATGLAPFLGMLFYNSEHGQTLVFIFVFAMAVLAWVMCQLAARHLDVNDGIVETTSHAVARILDADEGLGRKRPRRVARSHWLDFSSYFDLRAVPIATIVAMCAFAFGAALTFMDTYSREIGLVSAGQWYFLVYGAVILVARPLGGIIQDRKGDDIVVIPLIISTAAGICLTALAHSPLVLLVGAALLGMGYATIVSAGQAISVDRVGVARSGLAVSSYFLIVDMGTGVSPAILGALVDPLGFRGMMLAAGAVALVALVLYLLIVFTRPYRHGGGRLDIR
ncbi:MFS transporter [Gleimia hominis]|uniref:MFS transporter n=1 Tax=Gleimia hominis TaxID=595468 RepID=A0ABU3I8X3_9ACTO|nr:MFS transporter [Gleimia hominis]MDT3766825.1 MFS transporter [Gleimia hominis]